MTKPDADTQQALNNLASTVDELDAICSEHIPNCKECPIRENYTGVDDD